MYKNLQLSAEQMRRLGYQAVDMIVDHISGIKNKPVSRVIDGEFLRHKLTEPLPESGSDPEQLLAYLHDRVFNHITHVDHPHFFAYVPGPNNYVGVVADFLASGFNIFPTAWIAAAGAEQVELTTIDWFKTMVGFPDSAGGLFVSGGSMANLTALAVARQVKLDNDIDQAVVYFSDQTHFSVERALKVLGFQPHQLRWIETDDRLRISVDALKRQIEEDRMAGKKPFCVIANVGTTNTGAVDPLNELADVCREVDAWLHADGAYGAPAALTDKGRELLRGMERVDSLTMDPHKWLFQPYDAGCVLVRNRRHLRETFSMAPEYLQDIDLGNDQQINFGECGIELSRRFRALKVWLSLKAFGAESFRQAIDHGIMLAEQAEAFVRQMEDWEVVTPAQLGVLTIRYLPKGMVTLDTINEINKQLAEEVVRGGFAMVSTTTLKGKVVIRLCTIHPGTTTEELHQILARICGLAAELGASCKHPI
jgi:glutamate/tyrosine decarboxylase-like PLP-dependent enzyme